MSSSRTEAVVNVPMPQMGVSVAEGTVVRWHVAVGERIDAEQTICEISTDKIDTEVPAPVGGTVAEIVVPVETTVAVGAVLARIASEELGARAPSDRAKPAPTGSVADLSSRAHSPVVQRIAAKHAVDLARVAGTGRGGRVSKQDVLAFLAASPEQAPRPDDDGAPGSFAGEGRTGGEAVPGQLSRLRRQIGERMRHSLQTAAHCTTWIEVDMSRVEAARARLGLTALPFVAAAAVAALDEHPVLNAWLEGERYTPHREVNLGIAVSLGPNGLIVPVVERAHELSVPGLAARIKDLAARARARELTPEEVQGATFTITNPGQYGSVMATPIINQPQVAILDLEAVVKRAVVVTDAAGGEAIAIRPVTILGLSWDHRALDGGQAAQFLASVKHRLEGLASP